MNAKKTFFALTAAACLSTATAAPTAATPFIICPTFFYPAPCKVSDASKHKRLASSIKNLNDMLVMARQLKQAQGEFLALLENKETQTDELLTEFPEFELPLPPSIADAVETGTKLDALITAIQHKYAAPPRSSVVNLNEKRKELTADRRSETTLAYGASLVGTADIEKAKQLFDLLKEDASNAETQEEDFDTNSKAKLMFLRQLTLYQTLSAIRLRIKSVLALNSVELGPAEPYSYAQRPAPTAKADPYRYMRMAQFTQLDKILAHMTRVQAARSAINYVTAGRQGTQTLVDEARSASSKANRYKRDAIDPRHFEDQTQATALNTALQNSMKEFDRRFPKDFKDMTKLQKTQIIAEEIKDKYIEPFGSDEEEEDFQRRLEKYAEASRYANYTAHHASQARQTDANLANLQDQMAATATMPGASSPSATLNQLAHQAMEIIADIRSHDMEPKDLARVEAAEATLAAISNDRNAQQLHIPRNPQILPN